MDWKDSFEDQFDCKVIEGSETDPRLHIKIRMDRDEIPSLSDVGKFFSREVPDAETVVIETNGRVSRTHIKNSNGNWSYVPRR
ncbi:hypothetical protein [Mesorhizobium sp. WSM2239]|uniref:Uncharacterized protein n=2 Tax=unclassified Mesorhizobium TaxID=325217 RepID=A0AAU8D2L0_9HYPH